jgi:hypothetical protein
MDHLFPSNVKPTLVNAGVFRQIMLRSKAREQLPIKFAGTAMHCPLALSRLTVPGKLAVLVDTFLSAMLMDRMYHSSARAVSDHVGA